MSEEEKKETPKAAEEAAPEAKKAKPPAVETTGGGGDSSPSSKPADTETTPRGSPVVYEKLSYPEYLEHLKKEAFYTENVSLLLNHKFVTDVKGGKLSTNRAKRFVAENYYVLKSDLRTFEVACDMYGGLNDTYGKFFEFLRIAASYADLHLQNLRQALKVTEAELAKYEPSPKTHCYPSYFSTPRSIDTADERE